MELTICKQGELIMDISKMYLCFFHNNDLDEKGCSREGNDPSIKCQACRSEGHFSDEELTKAGFKIVYSGNNGYIHHDYGCSMAYRDGPEDGRDWQSGNALTVSEAQEKGFIIREGFCEDSV